MWWIYVILYIVFAISFNQCYKIVTKTTKSDGTLTVLLQSIAGIFALLLSFLFFLIINLPQIGKFISF